MCSPRLLLLDEPSLGLAPVVVDHIFDLFSGLRDRGITVLLVEQNAHRALEVADRAYVMSTGQIDFEGTAAALYDSPRLMQSYLGLGDDIPGAVDS
jgi:branched-chain amino acid transport system ATP-binding protein